MLHGIGFDPLGCVVEPIVVSALAMLGPLNASYQIVEDTVLIIPVGAGNPAVKP